MLIFYFINKIIKLNLYFSIKKSLYYKFSLSDFLSMTYQYDDDINSLYIFIDTLPLNNNL